MFKKINIKKYCKRCFHTQNALLWISSLVITLIYLTFLSCAPKRNAIRNEKSPPKVLNYSHPGKYEKEDYSWGDSREVDLYSSDYYDEKESNNSYYIPSKREYNLDHKTKKIFYEPQRDERRSYQKFSRKENKHYLKDIRPIIRKENNHREKKEKYLYYMVRRGDTLYRISKKFNVEIKKILTVNRIKNMSRIRIGRKLKIPITRESEVVSNTNRRAESSPTFRWPVKKVIDIKRDGQRGVRSIGIIITVKPGADVLSSASGTVMKIGRMRGFGNYIVVKHENRYITVYSNLNKINVNEGERIREGRSIGSMNHSNNKLHFQINYAGKPKNPLMLLPKI